MNGRLRLTVGVRGVGGAQQCVARGDGVHTFAQPRHVERPGYAVGQADVEDRPGGVGHLNEPHAALAVGHAAGAGALGRLAARLQSALGQLAA